MLTLTSKTGVAKGKQKTVYEYISDFRNFEHLLPSEQLKNIRITDKSMEFTMDGFGNIGLQIAERYPSRQLVIKAIEGTAADFTFRITIAEDTDNTSKVHIELEANLNMFIEMMARGPIQRFLDMMIDKLGEIDFRDKKN